MGNKQAGGICPLYSLLQDAQEGYGCQRSHSELVARLESLHLGVLGNAFALRCLAKISSSDLHSGFLSWAERGAEQFLLVVEAFPESSRERGCC